MGLDRIKWKASRTLDICHFVKIATTLVVAIKLNGLLLKYLMAYEPGSTDCRLLIDAKHHLEEALLTLYAMPHTDHIQRQLKAVYRQLEGMHDLKRAGGSQVSLQSADWYSGSVQT